MCWNLLQNNITMTFQSFFGKLCHELAAKPRHFHHLRINMKNLYEVKVGLKEENIGKYFKTLATAQWD